MRARLPLRRAAFVQPTLIGLRRSVRKKRFQTVQKKKPFSGRDAVGSTGAERLFLAGPRGRTSAAGFRVQHAGRLCAPFPRTTAAPSVKRCMATWRSCGGGGGEGCRWGTTGA